MFWFKLHICSFENAPAAAKGNSDNNYSKIHFFVGKQRCCIKILLWHFRKACSPGEIGTFYFRVKALHLVLNRMILLCIWQYLDCYGGNFVISISYATCHQIGSYLQLVCFGMVIFTGQWLESCLCSWGTVTNKVFHPSPLYSPCAYFPCNLE